MRKVNRNKVKIILEDGESITVNGQELNDLLGVENEELEPASPGILQSRDRRVGAHIVTFEELKNSIATDLCGRFPITSTRGMKYILLLYDYDGNSILATPLRSREGSEITRGYKFLYEQLTDAGIVPVLQHLDNEISKDLIAAIKANNLNYQLASLHDHRLNPCERAVAVFKEHLISILAGVDPNFPAALWCRLIPQTVTTLNMLRKSRINPRLSAHDQLFGAYNYNRCHLAPLGTKIIIHDKPEARPTWGFHGSKGWLIGNTPHHYRHFEVYIPKTGGTRVSDTI